MWNGFQQGAAVIRLRLFIASAVLAWCSSAFALNTVLDVSQYAHTAWRIRDGFARGRITSIVQTADGYLWLGTELGLLRFDGVKAVAWQPPAGQRLPSNVITALLVARDQTLWIATDQGLASWKDGQLNQHDALTGGYVNTLLEDREGTIWLTRFFNNWTLCQVENARTTCHGTDGGAGAGALGLYEDRQGQLWVGTSTGLWRWRPGTPIFYPLAAELNGIQGFSETTDGSLLISNAGGIRRFVDGQAVMEYPFPSSSQSVPASRLLRDRDGGLWAGTSGRGLVHVHEGVTDVFAQTDGLSGDNVSALFEDREGNIWVATADGLDRFRESAVVSYSDNQGFSNTSLSILASSDGSLWVGAFDGLRRWVNGQLTVYRERPRQVVDGTPIASRGAREITGIGVPARVHSIFEDGQRRLWVSSAEGVGYLAGGKFVSVKGVPGGLLRAIAEDRHATLWIANIQAGLFRVSPGSDRVEQFAWNTLQRQDPVTAMVADPSGEGLWFGFFRGGISYFSGAQVRASYSASDGLAEGRVSALYSDAAGTVWIAADGGLSRLRDGRVLTLTSRNGLPCDAVGWIIEDDARSLWLGMECGLVRITRSEIDAWTAAADQGQTDQAVTPRVQATVLDHSDGVRILVKASYFTAPVARSADGRLWFASQDGLSVVDPTRLPVNKLPPPVQVEHVVADRTAYGATNEAGGPLRLPPLIRDVEINYTALSFVAPEKVRFRYKLEGYDSDWQDVGTRRQAFYNGLPPGNYRFRVTASNNSGVWNEDGAYLDFSVAPSYYQTTWFAALSTATVIALVWGVHRVRLRIVEKHQGEISALNERLMKAQEQERIRIAGELHDGVMQEMLAVTMMLGTAKRRIPEGVEAKATIDKIQDKLIRVGTDIRRLSHDLHPPILQEAGLPEAVRAYCEEFSTTSSVSVSCDADESARDLSRGAALALFRILQEALGNAAKHASAKRIIVRLTRSESVVRLTVSDDGVGFDPSRFATGGGLGLIMMRERATQLNGTFEFDSAPGRGTTISVVVPFR